MLALSTLKFFLHVSFSNCHFKHSSFFWTQVVTSSLLLVTLGKLLEQIGLSVVILVIVHLYSFGSRLNIHLLGKIMNSLFRISFKQKQKLLDCVLFYRWKHLRDLINLYLLLFIIWFCNPLIIQLINLLSKSKLIIVRHMGVWVLRLFFDRIMLNILGDLERLVWGTLDLIVFSWKIEEFGAIYQVWFLVRRFFLRLY